MWRPFESWQLNQLEKLADSDPERFESILNVVWAQHPGLLKQLALAAIEDGALSINDAAKVLDIPVDMVQEQVLLSRVESRRSHIGAGSAVIVYESGSEARLAGGKIAVWEVVRAYRRLGSMERLRETFPSLTPVELAAAVDYAAKNPGEIEDQIEKYESLLERRRSLYPYAK